MTAFYVAAVQPDEAIAAARARKIELPQVYYGRLRGIERATAFSIAGIAAADQLQQTLDSLTQALQDGMTFDEWKKEALQSPDVLSLPRHRLDNIFRTNIQGAYARGKCVNIAKNKDTRPYLRYSAINDSRVRPTHLAMDGLVAPVDDQIWTRWMPPAGYRCRCTVTSMTEKEAKKWAERDRRRLSRDPEAARARQEARLSGPDSGWDYSPCEDMQHEADRAAAGKKYNPKLEQRVDEVKQKAETIVGEYDTTGWRKVGGQLGSNEGGLYEAPGGQKYYVKIYVNSLQARGEVAAAKIYRMLGIEAPDARLVEIDGRTAVASPWRDDFQRVDASELQNKKHRRDIARIHAASVLVKNWDVVGLEYDNIVMTKSGRLAVVDTGGSFEYRAQGGHKDYGPDIEDVKSFRDPLINPQASSVFGYHFNSDVWAEQAGARPLLDLRKQDVEKAFLEAGYVPKTAESLTETLWKRRALLIDRYDLRGKRRPKGFGKHMKEFKKWGTERIPTKNVPGSKIQEVIDPKYIEEDLISKFDAYIEKRFGEDSTLYLHDLYSAEWSGDSSSNGGGALKVWANRRFGAKITFHNFRSGADGAKAAMRDAKSYMRAGGIDESELFEMLDAEYEFNQYYLRRIHGWDDLQVERGMSKVEYRNQFKVEKRNEDGTETGTFMPNSVTSTTTKDHIFLKERRVRMKVRVEDVAKTWYQGPRYMHYGPAESEYVIIGRKVQAEGSGEGYRF